MRPVLVVMLLFAMAAWAGWSVAEEGAAQAITEGLDGSVAEQAGGGEAPPSAEEAPTQPITPSPAPSQRVPGEVVNGGFEKGLEGWQTPPGAQATVEADPAAAKSGKASARLSARRADVAAWLAQDIPLAGAAGRVEVSYWARPTLGGPARIVARLDFLDAAGGKVMTRYLQHVGRDSKKWQQVKGVIEVSAQARSLRLTLRLVGVGGAWVDDVAVKFSAEALVVWPRRMACVEGQPCAVELVFWAKPEAPLLAKVDDQREIEASVHGEMARLALPALPVGRHVLSIAAGEARDEVEVWCVPASRRPRMVSETGLWLLKQKPGLASLIHHASVPDLAEVTAHGFSVAEVLAPESPDGLTRLLRPLARESVPVLIAFPAVGGDVDENWRGKVLQTIRANAAEQRIAGWLLASEPDVQLQAASSAQLYLDAKKADGLHPLVVVLAGTEEIGFWGAFADVVLVNCCGLGQDPARIASLLKQARGGLESWQVLGAMLPAGWGPAGFQPDAMRARLLAFSAVAGGASVVSWYALRATGWDLRASPLWPSLRDLSRDLAKLSDAVADHPEAKDVRAAPEGVLWRAWADGDTRIVLLVNATGAAVTASVMADLPLADATSLVYEAKPAVTPEGLSVALEPGAVAIVRARLGPAGTSTKPEPGQDKPEAQPDEAETRAPSVPEPVFPAVPPEPQVSPTDTQ